MKIKLILEYDGGKFCGWQIQPGVSTVQHELERALTCYLTAEAKKNGEAAFERVVVTGSGRTDAGVHARGQVASFVWPKSVPYDRARLVAALNGLTPRELAVLDAQEVDDSFDARQTSHCKCYSYSLILRSGSLGCYEGRGWRIPPNVDIRSMIAAATSIRGTHDFSSFRASDCPARTTIRTIVNSEFARPEPGLLVYSIQGNGFLKQMVRIIVGTLVEIGVGKRSVEDMVRVMEARDRTLAGVTAPPSGLVLEWVKYSS